MKLGNSLFYLRGIIALGCRVFEYYPNHWRIMRKRTWKIQWKLGLHTHVHICLYATYGVYWLIKLEGNDRNMKIIIVYAGVSAKGP